MPALVFAAVTGLLLTATTADPVVGKWQTVSVTRGDMPDPGLKGAAREHTADGKYKITPAAGSKSPAVEGTYKLDATKSPAHIDMKPATGRYKDRTLQGIYKVEGDVLTIAFAEPGQPRPTDFEPRPDRVVAVHKKGK